MKPSIKHRVIFVTGTDTEVGKTRVSAALLNALAAQGLSTAALKPVAAGADSLRGEAKLPSNSDALVLQGESSVEQSYAAVNPVLLPEPIAPHIAAQHAGVSISLGELVDAAHSAKAAADVLVVEGAGGWLVPINDGETLADLASALNAGVVLVVGMKLGCLNHALLSAAAIRSAGCELVGWVANSVDPSMLVSEENIDSLRQRLAAPLLARLAWAPEELPATTAANFDLASLLS